MIPGRANIVRWDLDLNGNTVRLRDPASARIKLEFPAIPMLGCLGVAAAGDFGPDFADRPAPYGGNMDYNQVREGATVILPVFHRGALLFVGDGHALMADGEPTGNGIETSMDVEFRWRAQKGSVARSARGECGVRDQRGSAAGIRQQPGPRAADGDHRYGGVADQEYKLEPWAAHLLIAMQGKYDVVTVAGSMALKIPKKYLPANDPLQPRGLSDSRIIALLLTIPSTRSADPR